MDKLDKTYEAVTMLETLGLPVSNEQLIAIAQMEKEYLRDEIIPLIKQELEPMVVKMRNQFNLKVVLFQRKRVWIFNCLSQIFKVLICYQEQTNVIIERKNSSFELCSPVIAYHVKK